MIFPKKYLAVRNIVSTFALDHRIGSNAEVRLLNVMAQRSGRSGYVVNLVVAFLFIINAKNDELGRHNDDYVTREANNQTKYNMDMKKKEVIEFIKNEMKPFSNVHLIDDCSFALRFYCVYCSLNNRGIKRIMDKYPGLYLYIEDGLLCFGYTNYEE